MSSVKPFTYNAVDLRVVTINEKPWTRAREVCNALEYGKATKAAYMVRDLCSKANFVHKWRLAGFVSETKPVDWPKDSQKYDIYTNEEGMYELLFSSQQPKAKDFRRHCFNILLPHVRQQFSDTSHAMEIEGLTSRVQVLEITNEAHQQAIEEKDATISLLNDDLKNREHNNVALQAQRDVYKKQLQKCQDIITHLRTRYVDYAKHPGKENIVVLIEENTTSEEDEFYEYPYYIARIQRRFITTKRQWFKAQYPHHRPIIEELDNANSIHAFNRFEEKGYVERFQCHFRLVDIPDDVLYALATPSIQE